MQHSSGSGSGSRSGSRSRSRGSGRSSGRSTGRSTGRTSKRSDSGTAESSRKLEAGTEAVKSSPGPKALPSGADSGHGRSKPQHYRLEVQLGKLPRGSSVDKTLYTYNSFLRQQIVRRIRWGMVHATQRSQQQCSGRNEEFFESRPTIQVGQEESFEARDPR